LKRKNIEKEKEIEKDHILSKRNIMKNLLGPKNINLKSNHGIKSIKISTFISRNDKMKCLEKEKNSSNNLKKSQQLKV